MDIGEEMKPWMLLAIALIFLAGAALLSTFENPPSQQHLQIKK